jgi:Zn-dependent protease/CBS domain-containing protein
MRGSIKLGKIAGIGVFIHWTFALLLLYIVVSNYREGQDALQILWAVIFILSIFVTVFLHELGHALAAKHYHINTKDITLLPIGGVARLESIPEKPSEELVVAFAGPAVNIGLALITAIFITFPDMDTFLQEMSGGVNAGNFFLNFFVVNFWLAMFNLIPAFPMDGGRVLRALLSMGMQRHKATLIAARIGQVLALGFIILGFYANPFLIFIGIFIMFGAQSEANMTKTDYMMKGARVIDIVMKNYETIDENENIDKAVHLLLNGQSKIFLVTSNDEPIGTLSRDEIIRALAGGGSQAAVHTMMNKELIRLDAGQPIEEAYSKMSAYTDTLALVYDKQAFIGVLDMENILEFILVKDTVDKTTS